MSNRKSELRTAKQFLADEYPASFTPEYVAEYLHLSQKGATLARKFREAVRHGELCVSYYRNARNEEIAQYRFNPDYAKLQKDISHADFLRDQARDEGMMEGME